MLTAAVKIKSTRTLLPTFLAMRVRNKLCTIQRLRRLPSERMQIGLLKREAPKSLTKVLKWILTRRSNNSCLHRYLKPQTTVSLCP